MRLGGLAKQPEKAYLTDCLCYSVLPYRVGRFARVLQRYGTVGFNRERRRRMSRAGALFTFAQAPTKIETSHLEITSLNR